MSRPDPPAGARDARGRFTPGTSGNPGGRPRGRVSFTESLRRALEADADDGRPIADRLAETLVRAALTGDLRAIALIADRTEGRAIPAESPAMLEQVTFARLSFDGGG
ncbi:MAG: DUF5681 domain-containing protein [Phycisphaerales bacterium]